MMSPEVAGSESRFWERGVPDPREVNSPTLFDDWRATLSPGDRWAHCGRATQHDAHTHTVSFTGETPIPGVPCCGTPNLRERRGVADLAIIETVLRRAGVTDPGALGVRLLAFQRDDARRRAERAEKTLRQLRAFAELGAEIEWGVLLRELKS
jgi:hypothetical protein